MFNLYILLSIIFIFLIYLAYFIVSITKQKKKQKKKRLDTDLEPSKRYENKICRMLSNYFKINCLFQNIHLETLNGGVTEIDVLAIHNTGIYVIECKYMIGEIQGTADDKFWLQIRNDNTSIDFLNPVIQNNIHVNACKKLLDKFKLPYYSIIVFGNNCTLPDIKSYKTKKAYIIRRKELIPLIKYLTSQKQIYSNKVINAISELVRVTSRKVCQINNIKI